jgi:hypothetical protein
MICERCSALCATDAGLLVGQRAELTREKNLHVADNRRQRRRELMRHAVQERGLLDDRDLGRQWLGWHGALGHGASAII